ncbi:MAG: metallophosphoesterase [Candidatus Nanoarchaeia archaeon]|nr:metallophosphoesterase [Candidatus Haiyanarchaeum thermophilum]MCW1303127.1 metallophosphoesterase [Candidatus Haiyanarchaeum thermophilum]MCW1306593.1 metallophosphoesterase [Candidatus Haiyanarchaeum thermophilum]MCW1307005.1 metallophosphoesterase [Candidatus Haiyanarchaeum thermophilum]MCW1308703.1 metallophosphoesterase [Candidatus Haiyanarchaeum thermophilum]
MELFPGMRIINSFPALYIEPLDLLVISDLHLGFEGIMSEQGVFLPKVQFTKLIEIIGKVLQEVEAENLLINGDLKHEFSETTYHEFKEVGDFLTFAKERFKRVIVIKGNHDNFIIYVTKRYGAELYDELNLRGFYFLHGHKPIDWKRKFNCLIIGHEHPSIVLFDEIGGKEKVKCFLYGEVMGKKLIVMPAMSYFAYGTDINLIPRSELLSPILKEIEVDSLKAVGLIEGEQLLRFPTILELKKAQRLVE